MEKDNILNSEDLFVYLGEQLVKRGFKDHGNNHYYLINDFFHKIFVTITKSQNPILSNDYFNISLYESNMNSNFISGGNLLIQTINRFPNKNIPDCKSYHQIVLVENFINSIFKIKKIQTLLRKRKINNIKNKILNINLI